MRTEKEILEARNTMGQIFVLMPYYANAIAISVLDWTMGKDNETQDFLNHWRKTNATPTESKS